MQKRFTVHYVKPTTQLLFKELKKTLEFGILNIKGVCVFIYNKWWMQLAKYPRVGLALGGLGV